MGRGELEGLVVVDGEESVSEKAEYATIASGVCISWGHSITRKYYRMGDRCRWVMTKEARESGYDGSSNRSLRSDLRQDMYRGEKLTFKDGRV